MEIWDTEGPPRVRNVTCQEALVGSTIQILSNHENLMSKKLNFCLWRDITTTDMADRKIGLDGSCYPTCAIQFYVKRFQLNYPWLKMILNSEAEIAYLKLYIL